MSLNQKADFRCGRFAGTLPDNSVRKSRPLRGPACAVTCTTPPCRKSVRLNSGVRRHRGLFDVKLPKAVLPLIFFTCTASAQVQAPERPPGYAPLKNFVGRWTTQGREDKFLEVCSWYHGEFHVVCNATSKRADGSTGHSMSILGYVPGSGYVYSGIGSKGRYETFDKGTWSEGRFTFDTTIMESEGKTLNRISIGPFTDRGFLFVVTTSTDGVVWKPVDTTTYIKLN